MKILEINLEHLWSALDDPITLENLEVMVGRLWHRGEAEIYAVNMRLLFFPLYDQKIVSFKGVLYYCTIERERYRKAYPRSLDFPINDVMLEAFLMGGVELNIKHLEGYNSSFYTLDDLKIDPTTRTLFFYVGVTRILIYVKNKYAYLYRNKFICFKEEIYYCTITKKVTSTGANKVSMHLHSI